MKHTDIKEIFDAPKFGEEVTVCGWVRKIGREGTEKRILTLAELRDEKVDMFTTVYVGNSATQILSERMVTGRGYRM